MKIARLSSWYHLSFDLLDVVNSEFLHVYAFMCVLYMLINYVYLCPHMYTHKLNFN